jgi:aryl-alcohol dehydrogenase-like predicted oxidoreductase
MTNQMIEKQPLGKSDIRITKVGVGLWAIGGDAWGETDDEESLDMIAAALDLGINFFDTADVYGDGHSEVLLGRAMKGRRDQFVVATKIGWKGFDGEKGVSAYDSVEKIVSGVEESLKRLQTEYVDLIQCHIDFREPNMPVFVEGFQQLKDQGKVRAYGVSASDFDYLRAFNADNRASSLQIDYSILNRTPESRIFPYTMEKDLGVLVRGPLAMGILTGKFNRNTRFERGDFRNQWIEDENAYRVFLNDLDKVEKLKPLTDGRSLAQLAIQFVMQHPAVTAAIPGAKRIDQLKENLKAALLPELSPDALEWIDAITPPGGGRKIWPA